MITTSILAISFAHLAFMPAKTEWAVLPPIVHKNLAIYPVVDRANSNVGTNYITLDEGLKTGTVRVTEMDEGTPLIRPRNGVPAGQTANSQQRTQSHGAQVNSLAIINESGKMLILMAGEMVIGGKQDRIIQKDGLIAPSKYAQSLEVFCVEHGRWSGNVSGFTPAPNSAGKAGAGGYGGGGAVADPTIRGSAQSAGSQSEVWAKVEDKNRKSGVATEATTYQGTLNSAKNQKDSGDYLKAMEAKFPKKAAVGAIVSVNGHLIWADCFADDSIFQKYEGKLMRSYVVEAITEFLPSTAYDHPSAAKAREFLFDNSGTSTFEGKSDVYKLTRIVGKSHLIHELTDVTGKGSLAVHFNKMLKK
jgi:hypothetical protein